MELCEVVAEMALAIGESFVQSFARMSSMLSRFRARQEAPDWLFESVPDQWNCGPAVEEEPEGPTIEDIVERLRNLSWFTTNERNVPRTEHVRAFQGLDQLMRTGYVDGQIGSLLELDGRQVPHLSYGAKIVQDASVVEDVSAELEPIARSYLDLSDKEFDEFWERAKRRIEGLHHFTVREWLYAETCVKGLMATNPREHYAGALMDQEAWSSACLDVACMNYVDTDNYYTGMAIGNAELQLCQVIGCESESSYSQRKALRDLFWPVQPKPDRVLTVNEIERLGVRLPEGIVTVTGMNREQFEEALAQYRANRRQPFWITSEGEGITVEYGHHDYPAGGVDRAMDETEYIYPDGGMSLVDWQRIQRAAEGLRDLSWMQEGREEGDGEARGD